MSDYRDERHDDASTPSASGSDAANHTQPTTPLPAAADAQPTVPLPGPAPISEYPAPVAPYGRPTGPSSFPASYGAPTSGPTGGPAYPQQAPQPHAAYVGARPEPKDPAGGHTTPDRFGAVFGQTQATGTPAFAAGSTTTEPRKRGAGMLVGALALAALVGLGAGVGGAYIGNSMFSASSSTPAQGPHTVTINNPDKVNTVAAVSAKVSPGVVTLSVAGQQESGSGSGVVLSEDGYVLTNTHVVTLGGAEADAKIRVTTSDGRIFDATIVGTDPLYDLAVVKLTGATDLTPVAFGDSSKLNVGDQTIALGSPLGLDDTVTSGIVSALNRSIQIQSSAVPDSTGGEGDGQNQQNSPKQFQFDLPGTQTSSNGSISISVIQTDAAINPGNSGGALVNSDGELIGVNVAIASAGGAAGESGNIGVGFAIPSNVAERVSQEIIKNGKATHGLLGASVGDAAYAADATTEGALVKEIVSGGAAQKAGLKVGDIVTGLGDAPIGTGTDLTAQVRALAAGADTTLTFNRDGKSHTVDVTLGALKS